MKLFRRISLVFCLVALFDCGWMSNDTMETFYEGEVIERQEAITRLKGAILANMNRCPQNYYAGLFGAGEVVGEELRDLHYYQDSIVGCEVFLVTTPCTLNPDSNTITLANLYRTVIRMCHPRKAGL